MKLISKKSSHNSLVGFYGPPLKQPINPDTLLFAFDIHSVLFYRDWKSIITYLWHLPQKITFLLFLINPFFWLRVWRIWKKTSVGDDIYDQLAEIYPSFKNFKDHFIALENMQTPDVEMVNIIITLKASGYSLYILSNIGQRAFADLAKKNPNILHIFDHVYLPQKENNYRQKPSAHFFQDFLSFVISKNDGDKSILFIDDRIVNIENAAKKDISGLLFKNHKSLIASLERLSIIPAQYLS